MNVKLVLVAVLLAVVAVPSLSLAQPAPGDDTAWVQRVSRALDESLKPADGQESEQARQVRVLAVINSESCLIQGVQAPRANRLTLLETCGVLLIAPPPPHLEEKWIPQAAGVLREAMQRAGARPPGDAALTACVTAYTRLRFGPPAAARQCAADLGQVDALPSLNPPTSVVLDWRPGDGMAVGTRPDRSSPPGESSGSLAFDGRGGHVVIPDQPDLRFTMLEPFSIAMWARQTSRPEPNIVTLIGKREGCEAMNYQLAVDPLRGFSLASQDGIWVGSNLDLSIDEWVHAAMTYDGQGGVVLYLNGDEVARGGSFSLGPPLNLPLKIGASGTCDYSFPGLIGSARIYRGALTPAEVRDLAKPGG